MGRPVARAYCMEHPALGPALSPDMKRYTKPSSSDVAFGCVFEGTLMATRVHLPSHVTRHDEVGLNRRIRRDMKGRHNGVIVRFRMQRALYTVGARILLRLTERGNR